MNTRLHLQLCSLSYAINVTEKRLILDGPSRHRQKLKYIPQVWGGTLCMSAAALPVQTWWPATWLPRTAGARLWAREKGRPREPFSGGWNDRCWLPAHLPSLPGFSSDALFLILGSPSIFSCLSHLLYWFSNAPYKVCAQLEKLFCSIFRGQLLHNLISHNKYTPGRWKMGGVLESSWLCLGFRGYLKRFSCYSTSYLAYMGWPSLLCFLGSLVDYQLKLRKCRVVLDISINFSIKSDIFIHTHFYQLSSSVSAKIFFLFTFTVHKTLVGEIVSVMF